MKYKFSYPQSLNTVKLPNIVMKTTALLLATMLIYACSGNKPQATAPPVPGLPVSTVSQSSETTFLEYPAAIQGAADLEIRPQVAGALDRVFINEGQYVAAGQPLFKINEQPFLEALNTAKASLSAAEAAILNAQLEVDKLVPLVQNKVVSDVQLKTAKATLQIAKANAAQAKAGVAAAQINLAYTIIKAPVSGYIGLLPKKQGSLVSPSDTAPLTQLSDVHEVRVYFSLGEDDFIDFNSKYSGKTLTERIKNVPSVALVLADQSVYPQEGKIDMVDGQFDKQTGAITLRASFPNAQGLLRSGNTGKIRISMEHKNALIVPQSATVEMQDKIFVFTVADSNKVKKMPISIIGKSGTNYLVKEGVKSGDQIVLSGLDRLQEGQEIRPEKPTNKVARLN
ncbi:membrane fusion protein, multidrug efflux system [Pedobacter africanus]|uniref:Membrane fusion protein, multidrug efflux system n=2 Tax=Pedobacter africanus TaxID=151894 RepID=A0A1W2D120_9SPHI|nr:membrane fusion protein, multidrug efflux system [Pedobacter africanus]